MSPSAIADDSSTGTMDNPVSESLSESEWQAVRQLQKKRIEAINSVVGSVVAIYDEDRKGGGSGVVVDPSGLALTNHHVIQGAGVEGWGGMADGELYHWTLIGTDPGGDVSLIQLEGRDDFPYTPLGDSDTVRVGDWALAMGNPFILTEDQYPTITMGIVSGIKRYQPGAGGSNQLVYGNCIQVDSSINPGNSGGPLFNFHSRVIGINGRGSFKERGRVNVGLGYAISANQIKNFLPDLLATKLVQHGTLDANFSDRAGRVVCSTINVDAPVAEQGLELGDELLEFEGEKITDANQFTNLICTLPADWPATLKIRDSKGQTRTIHTRLLGLPYPPSPKVREPKGEKELPPEQQKKLERQMAMLELLSADPGEIRDEQLNRDYAWQIIDQWLPLKLTGKKQKLQVLQLKDDILVDGNPVGQQTIYLSNDGRYRVQWDRGDQSNVWIYDGKQHVSRTLDQPLEPMADSDARQHPVLLQAQALSLMLNFDVEQSWGVPTIDGSDKSQLKNAWRLRFDVPDLKELFVWLEMEGPDGLPAPRLSKISANKNCDPAENADPFENVGGVTFRDWQNVSSTDIAITRELVHGLEERPQFTLELKDFAWLKSPADELFATNIDSENQNPDADHTPVALPEGPASQSPKTINEPGYFESAIAQSQPKMVKVVGAAAGKVEGFSTGFLISNEGHILTMQGVYLDGRQVRVILADGTEHQATVLKRDRTTQLALLKVEADTPEYFELTDQPQGKKGDWIVALTNAFKVADKNEPLSATLGVISLPTTMEARLNRRDVAYKGELFVIDCITSNPGAGGGAVIDAGGRLVGMVGKIISSSETNTRLNYTVPVTLLYDFVNQSTTSEPEVAEQPSEQAELGIILFRLGGRSNPAYIDRVRRGSPAAEADLQPDDMIVSLGGEQIGTVKEFDNALTNLRPDQEIIIIVKRGVDFLRIPITPVAKK